MDMCRIARLLRKQQVTWGRIFSGLTATAHAHHPATHSRVPSGGNSGNSPMIRPSDN